MQLEDKKRTSFYSFVASPERRQNFKATKRSEVHGEFLWAERYRRSRVGIRISVTKMLRQDPITLFVVHDPHRA